MRIRRNLIDSLAVTTVFVAICVPAHAVVENTLQLRGAATVTRAVVRLGDVAVHCPRPLAGIRVMPAPGYGGVNVVSRATIQTRLYQSARIHVRFSGAQSVRIIRPGTDRSKEIDRRVRAAIAEALARVPEVTYELAPPVGELMFPPGPLHVACHLPDTFEGHRVVRVDVNVGSAKRTVNLSATFRRTIRVPIAARRLERGDTLRNADIRYEKRTFASRVPRLVKPGADPAAYGVIRTVAEGTLLTDRVVQRHPAVSAGDVVDLVVENRGIRLTAHARALQTGWIGSRIRVQNLVDRSFLYARVTAPGMVSYE